MIFVFLLQSLAELKKAAEQASEVNTIQLAFLHPLSVCLSLFLCLSVRPPAFKPYILFDDNRQYSRLIKLID